MTFDQLMERWTWKPIPNCPGRFVLADGGKGVMVRPQDLGGAETVFFTYRVAGARDAVVVGRLDTGGLISYQRRDGTYVHTLNTPGGFNRNLQHLGIALATDH